MVVLLVLPILARAQDNVRGGAEPVVSSIDPGTLSYDYLVDGNLAQDDPGKKEFRPVQAAYAAAWAELKPSRQSSK